MIVQLCDEKAAAIPGFEASAEIRGDHTDTVVHWDKGKLQEWSREDRPLTTQAATGGAVLVLDSMSDV